VPAGAAGVVVFAHGSGSSRHSPRNRRVAARLQEAGLATLLADLLTPGEEALDQRTRELRFDIELLARRLAAATAWVSAEPSLQDLPVGYFGASTGAAAALVAAADEPDSVGAVVSRGGRPDLAGDRLADIAAPTLLIVGGADTMVLELNRRAAARMRGEVAIEVVPGATHLFEEPGALDVVADLAARWLTHHLAPGPDHGGGADR
jgi:putative phosphoribosyl transferase